MQILRPERTGTQDDSVAMVNRNDLRIEFLQSEAKNLCISRIWQMRRSFLRFTQDRSPRRPPQDDSFGAFSAPCSAPKKSKAPGCTLTAQPGARDTDGFGFFLFRIFLRKRRPTAPCHYTPSVLERGTHMRARALRLSLSTLAKVTFTFNRHGSPPF